jgi:hypothetical protein
MPIAATLPNKATATAPANNGLRFGESLLMKERKLGT